MSNYAPGPEKNGVPWVLYFSGGLRDHQNSSGAGGFPSSVDQIHYRL
jgi:hypothetical protein